MRKQKGHPVPVFYDLSCRVTQGPPWFEVIGAHKAKSFMIRVTLGDKTVQQACFLRKQTASSASENTVADGATHLV